MAEKHEQWMPLYIADYLGDTMHLTAEQHGAYLLLLMAAWKRGGHVPDDDDQLAIITRMGNRWHTHAAAIVRAFFSQRDGMLWSTRIESELVKAKANTAKKSAAGKAGAAAKWQKDGARNGDPMATALRGQCQSYAPSPSPMSLPTGKEHKRSRAVVLAERPDDVPESTWADFQAIRKAKRAPLTTTALDGIKREAAKAGMGLHDALALCCSRGWQGFEASWIAKGQPASRPPIRENFDAVDYGHGIQDL